MGYDLAPFDFRAVRPRHSRCFDKTAGRDRFELRENLLTEPIWIYGAVPSLPFGLEASPLTPLFATDARHLTTVRGVDAGVPGRGQRLGSR